MRVLASPVTEFAPMPKDTLTAAWEDFQSARLAWLTYYRSIPKHGRTHAQSYKENGLWRRFRNRERKYEAAYSAARNSPPSTRNL